VQLSVFECDLTEKTVDKVLEGIVRYISPDEDSVRIYRLCAQCIQQVQTFGKQRVEAQPRDVIIV
jgi:CRISPR-associated protein Cas2